MIPRVVVENRFGLRQIQGTIQELGLQDSNKLPPKLEMPAAGTVFSLERIRPNYVLYRELPQPVETKGE